MHLVNLTTARIRKAAIFIFAIFIYSFATAQENSPYSRYGMGDLVPSQNITSRSMGGISAGFIDSTGLFPAAAAGGTVAATSINLSNPAALGSLNNTMFDLGGEIDVRTLKSNTSPAKYSSTNTIFSHLQLGFPITPKRMLAKGGHWNIAFGLRPQTFVNYKIQANKRLSGIDSITTLYEGTGGLNQANLSTGIKIKNFSFGFSSGYSFGNRETSTKIGFVSDTIPYQQSNTTNQSKYTGFFLNMGLQYAFRLRDNSVLRFGAVANLQQNLKASRNNINETFKYNSDGAIVSIDTVTSIIDQKGIIKLPASYTAGFTYTNTHWVVGLDVNYAQWSQYRSYGVPDLLQDNTTIHLGAQYFPATQFTTINKYWSFVKYRGGIYYGNDYVKLSSSRPDYGITLGAGFPLSLQRLRFGDFVTLNTGLEIGQHGNKTNVSVRENIFRLSFGIAMSADWFRKRKYD